MIAAPHRVFQVGLEIDDVTGIGPSRHRDVCQLPRQSRKSYGYELVILMATWLGGDH